MPGTGFEPSAPTPQLHITFSNMGTPPSPSNPVRVPLLTKCSNCGPVEALSTQTSIDCYSSDLERPGRSFSSVISQHIFFFFGGEILCRTMLLKIRVGTFSQLGVLCL